jgi:hypothetical protein
VIEVFTKFLIEGKYICDRITDMSGQVDWDKVHRNEKAVKPDYRDGFQQELRDKERVLSGFIYTGVSEKNLSNLRLMGFPEDMIRKLDYERVRCEARCKAIWEGREPLPDREDAERFAAYEAEIEKLKKTAEIPNGQPRESEDVSLIKAAFLALVRGEERLKVLSELKKIPMSMFERLVTNMEDSVQEGRKLLKLTVEDEFSDDGREQASFTMRFSKPEPREENLEVMRWAIEARRADIIAEASRALASSDIGIRVAREIGKFDQPVQARSFF